MLMPKKKKTKQNKQREVIKVPAHIEGHDAVPLLQAVQWFIRNMDAARGRDEFRRLLQGLEKEAVLPLKEMLRSTTESTVLEAVRLVVELRRLETRREGQEMKVLEQALVTLGSLQMAELQALVEQPDLNLDLLRPSPTRQRALVRAAKQLAVEQTA
jgi:hypothetical protein